MTRIIRPYAGFIIPERRFVDVGMPRSGVSASGRYQLIKRDAWGAEIERTPWFDNIILDSGLNRWGTGVIIAGAAIGTGTASPVASDTGLQTQSHYTTTTGAGSGITAGSAPNYNNTRTFVYRTVLGQLNGNYSEVGVGWVSGSMFSRALILDGSGNPTTISVSSSQQLDIVYQLSVYPPIVDTGPTTVTISGVNYSVTGRASWVSSTGGSPNWGVSQSAMSLNIGSASHFDVTNGALGAITSSPSGTPASPSGAYSSLGTYVNNSYQQTCAITYVLTAGNVSGGITASRVAWSIGAFQYAFSPAIPKDGTKTLVMNYSINWARR